MYTRVSEQKTWEIIRIESKSLCVYRTQQGQTEHDLFTLFVSICGSATATHIHLLCD